MTNLNTFICTGRLTRNISEIKGGLSFGIAHSRSYKNKDTNEWVNQADFFNCIMRIQNEDFKKSIKSRYSKGDPVVIYGEVQTWPSKNQDTGKDELSTIIIVNKIDKLENEFKNYQNSNNNSQDASFLDGIENTDPSDPELPFH